MWKFLVEDNEAIPAILWQANTQAGFTDKSSDVIALDAHGINSIGFKRTRDLIKAAVIADTNTFVTWATYDQGKKDIAVKWCCAPYALRVAEVSDAQDMQNWEIVIEQTMLGRTEIVENMRQRVGEEFRIEVLTKPDLDDFYDTTFPLFQSYIGANSPDFKDWLCNTVGTTYENDGFEQKSYHDQQLEDDLIAIYNGEY